MGETSDMTERATFLNAVETPSVATTLKKGNQLGKQQRGICLLLFEFQQGVASRAKG